MNASYASHVAHVLNVPDVADVPQARFRLRLTACLASVAMLSACGGGGGSAAPASSSPTPAANSVHITGAAVKGPVAGASVCAFPLNAGVRGAQLGSCATTGSDGSYDFTVPSAPEILLEARGGVYVDETTQVSTPLPSASAMTSVIGGDPGQVNAYVTPLTTLAVNAARASGALSLAGFRQQSGLLKTSLGLDAALDLSATAPVFGTQLNAYGRALAAVSRLASSGIGVSDFLAALDPAAIAAAFIQAYNAVGTPLPTVPPVSPETPAVPTEPSVSPVASGSLTVTGGPVAAFVPDATSFSVSIDKNDTVYRFEKAVTYPYGSSGLTASGTAYVSVTRRGQTEGGPVATTIVTASLAPELGLSGLKVKTCAGDCGITVATTAGSSHPVSLVFSNFDLSGWTLNGTLTGDATGAAWSVLDLPRTTNGIVSVSGVPATVITGSMVKGSGPGGTSRSVSLSLQSGAIVTVAQVLSPTGELVGNGSVSYLSPANVASFCAVNCSFTVTETSTSVAVAFNATLLEGGIVLNNTIGLLKTQGTVTSSALGSFSPISDGITSSNDTRTLVFSVLGTNAQSGISLIRVKTKGGTVEEVSVSTGIGIGVYQCFKEAASFIGVPACGGVTVSANGRTVSFAATAVGGGTGANKQTAVIDGVLTARGF